PIVPGSSRQDVPCGPSSGTAALDVFLADLQRERQGATLDADAVFVVIPAVYVGLHEQEQLDTVSIAPLAIDFQIAWTFRGSRKKHFFTDLQPRMRVPLRDAQVEGEALRF